MGGAAGSGAELHWRALESLYSSAPVNALFDSSLEVTGEGSVRVAKNRYTVVARPQQAIYRPNEKVAVDFKVLDVNDQPVEATGTVTVVRHRWEEIWIDPAGRIETGIYRD